MVGARAAKVSPQGVGGWLDVKPGDGGHGEVTAELRPWDLI